MVLLYLLPKNLLSRLVGWLVHRPLPRWLRSPVIGLFARAYRIRIDEAEKGIEDYPSIGDFFVRRLRSSARPLGEEGLLHPADSLVTQAGPIQDGQLVQAKGRSYSLANLLDRDEWAPTYRDGAFVTYYLCPTDYHRVHSPVNGSVRRVRHVPGALWPVNEWSVGRIADLFCVNERVIVEVDSVHGPVAAVFVGATNVGKITLAFWPEFATNLAKVRSPRERNFGPETLLSKGDELGTFHMGSTVVLLLSAQALRQLPGVKEAVGRLPGRKVRVRENFSKFLE